MEPEPLEEIAAEDGKLGSLPSETDAISCSWRGERDCQGREEGFLVKKTEILV